VRTSASSAWSSHKTTLAHGQVRRARLGVCPHGVDRRLEDDLHPPAELVGARTEPGRAIGRLLRLQIHWLTAAASRHAPNPSPDAGLRPSPPQPTGCAPHPTEARAASHFPRRLRGDLDGSAATSTAARRPRRQGGDLDCREVTMTAARRPRWGRYIEPDPGGMGDPMHTGRVPRNGWVRSGLPSRLGTCTVPRGPRRRLRHLRGGAAGTRGDGAGRADLLLRDLRAQRADSEVVDPAPMAPRRRSGGEEGEAACRGRCGGGSASPANRISAGRVLPLGCGRSARAEGP